MDLSIIIINYKTKEITANCLQSIKDSIDSYQKEVIVVDNDSGDDSVAYLKKRFPEFTIMPSGKNGGFAFGNNVGAKKAKGKFIWLLNSDTILQKNTIQLFMDQAVKKDVKVASCMLLNPDGTIQPQGGSLPTLPNLAAWMLFIDDVPFVNRLTTPYQQRSISYFKSDQNPGWLGGTALLIRRDVYEKMKGLDQDIFMYGEDTDFCLRLKKLGYSMHYFSTPKLTHLGQASGSSRGAVLGEYKGLKYLYTKHYPAWKLSVVRVLLKIGALLRIVLFGMIGKDETRKTIYQEAFKLA